MSKKRIVNNYLPPTANVHRCLPSPKNITTRPRPPVEPSSPSPSFSLFSLSSVSEILRKSLHLLSPQSLNSPNPFCFPSKFSCAFIFLLVNCLTIACFYCIFLLCNFSSLFLLGFVFYLDFFFRSFETPAVAIPRFDADSQGCCLSSHCFFSGSLLKDHANVMMNQGANTETMSAVDSSSLENWHVVNASHGQTASYLPSTVGSESLSWMAHKVDNRSTENGVPSNSTYHYDQHVQPPVSSSSSLGTVNAPQDYNGYSSYTNPSDPYGYGSTGYSSYYNGYQQQSNPSYSQPSVGAYQNTGAPYQPLSSFQNTGSYAGSASYSSTYYNPGDYQTAGGYPSSSYNNQTTQWSDTNYANYNSTQQYAHYSSGTAAGYSSGTGTATATATATAMATATTTPTPLNYQQHYKQWADYYNQTEVTCAPGTENTSVTGPSNFGCSVPDAPSGYPNSNNLPPPPYAPSWRPEPSSNEQSGAVVNGAYDGYWRHGLPPSQNHHTASVQPHIQKPLDQNSSYNSFQDQQKSSLPQGPNSQYPATHQVQPPVPSCPQGPNLQYASTYQVPPAPQTYQPSPQGVQSQTYQPSPQGLQSQTYQPSPQSVQSQTYQPSPQSVQSQTYQPSPQSLQSQTYPPSPQSALSLDTQRLNKVQIPTNPRIASNLTFGLPKTDKDSSTTAAVAKPAYISVSLPKPNDKVLSSAGADSILKPGMFPKSLRGYVERALARCKDDIQMAASQAVMKEMITKATADGTLYSRDWDVEPLFPLPNADLVTQESTLISSLTKLKRSPSRRTKSRWEPIPEEKPVEKPASINHETSKYAGWVNERDRKTLMMNNGSKDNNLTGIRYSSLEHKGANKFTQKPDKRQRLMDGFVAAENGDTSSDSDKEQSLPAYYAGAMALANSPEERKRRESRSKRFEKGQRHGAETNHLKSKSVGSGNLYSRRATAMVLSKNFEYSGSRAVEDFDWDALTVKGTCQEVEKRYLRLTSAPDPATVRPEEVLEKALLMVQNSHKNYLYKCDQMKSIRQDLTVQRIRNHLTVKVYETHARFALEVGDLPEYNQCASQLKSLYAEGIEGCDMEFAAYNLLCVIMHSNNNRDLVSSMSRLSNEAKKDEAVKHALAVRGAVTSGNYVVFFRLYKTAPNLNSCLMDLYVEKMRFKAVSCMSRSYRPTLPVSYVAQVLGFTSNAKEGSDEKDSDGLEECVEWLKAHGACFAADNNGEMQLDTKSTASSLYMPEPEDAVAHGDANLAVNDFLTRTSS